MTAAILATLLFSLSAVSGKRLSHHLSGVEANFWRFLLAAFLLVAYAHSFGLGLGGGALGLFFISGIIGFGVGDYGLFRAYPILGSRLTMVMTQCLAAPFAASIEWLWMGETLSLSQVLAGTGSSPIIVNNTVMRRILARCQSGSGRHTQRTGVVHAGKIGAFCC